MKNFRILLTWLFLSVAFLPLNSQTIVISGSGKGYSNKELRLFRISDPVTKDYIPLCRITCDNTGRFECRFEAVKDEYVVIRAGIYDLGFIIDTISDYSLVLPDYTALSPEDEQNSFFAYTYATPLISGINANVNNLISSFDSVYNPVFNRIAGRVMYNFRKGEIPEIISGLNKLTDKSDRIFYKDYVRYRLVMLNQVAFGHYPGRVEDSVFINSKFNPSNPAWCDLIEQMFRGALGRLASGKNGSMFRQAILASSSSKLKDLMLKEGMLSNEQLAEYVIILNLYMEAPGSSIPPANSLKILQELDSLGSNVFIRSLAEEVLHKMTALTPGTFPPPLVLKNEKGASVTLSDFRGKFVLVSFAEAGNAFSMSEYEILNTWLPRFSDRIVMISVLRDRNFNQAVSRMRNSGFGWLCLDGSKADIEAYNYEVGMLPAFLLVGRDGRIAVKPCPYPSERLENLIERLTEGVN